MSQVSLIDKAFLLKGTPLFSSLDLDLLLAVADKLGAVAFDADEAIFRLAEDAYHMYFIVSGEILLKDPSHQLIGTLSSGAYFGEESLLSNKGRGYEALSSTDSIVLTLSKTNLLTILSECPSVAISLLQEYSCTIDSISRRTSKHREAAS